MISAASFCDAGRDAGFALYTGVPCSYLTPFIDYVIAASVDGGLRYVGAADEACAVAIAAGAALGGWRAVVMLQNSGLGNAVNPLTSLCAIFELPVLLVVTLRGDDGRCLDEPQHALMGRITTKLLELMDVPWEPFPVDEAAIAPALARAVAHMERARTPYAFVVRKGDVGPGAPTAREALEASPPQTLPSLGPSREPPSWPTPRPSRTELLAAVQQAAGPHDVVLATTGHTGRELLGLGDRPNQLYVVGSMGCASSLAMGLAWTIPARRVIVVDGDGAALMHLGAMATLGRERPPNLVHVLLDNETHESTGGQATVSASADLAEIARACRYPRVVRVTSGRELVALLAEPARGLTFVHAKIRASVPSVLPRPTVHPRDVASRLRAFVGGGSR